MAHTTTLRNLTLSFRNILLIIALAGAPMLMGAASVHHDPEEGVVKVKFDQEIRQSDVDRIHDALFAEKSYGVTNIATDLNTRVMTVSYTAEPYMARVIFEVFKKLGYTVTYAN